MSYCRSLFHNGEYISKQEVVIVHTNTWVWKFKAKPSVNHPSTVFCHRPNPPRHLSLGIFDKWELINCFFCVLATWIHKQLLLAENFCYVTIISAVKDSDSQCVGNPMLFNMWELVIQLLLFFFFHSYIECFAN